MVRSPSVTGCAIAGEASIIAPATASARNIVLIIHSLFESPRHLALHIPAAKGRHRDLR
jgi:hypothetical protein